MNSLENKTTRVVSRYVNMTKYNGVSYITSYVNVRLSYMFQCKSSTWRSMEHYQHMIILIKCSYVPQNHFCLWQVYDNLNDFFWLIAQPSSLESLNFEVVCWTCLNHIL
jgi:hypothetical protein